MVLVFRRRTDAEAYAIVHPGALVLPRILFWSIVWERKQ